VAIGSVGSADAFGQRWPIGSEVRFLLQPTE